MWNDRLSRASVLAVMLAALPLWLPFVPFSFRSLYSDSIGDLLILPLLIWALLSRRSEIQHHEEKRFWLLWACALGVWLAVRVTRFCVLNAEWQKINHLVSDCLFLAGFFLMFLATEVRPHLPTGWSAGNAEFRYKVGGAALFSLCLLIYFGIVPHFYESELYWTWVPSLYLYLVCDMVLLLRLYILLRTCGGRRWSVMYSWLILVVATWSCLDTLEMLMSSGVIPYLPVGSPVDALWYLPYLELFLLARYRNLTLLSDLGHVGDENPAFMALEAEEPWAGGSLILYVFILPVLHSAMHILGVLDQMGLLVREGLVLASMTALGLLALSYSRYSERRRRKTERALLESEEEYRRLFENAPDVVFQTDLSGSISSLSPSVETLTGYSAGEMMGRPIQSIFQDPAVFSRLRESLMEQRHVRDFEVELVVKGGETARGSVNAYLLSRKNGKPSCIEGSIRDVTFRRSLEERLRQSQRMEAVGRLAGGIAHEFNNILTGILGYAELILSRLESPSPVQEDLHQIRELSNRAAGLTRQLLTFGRRRDLEPRSLDLNALIENTLQLLARILGERICVDFRAGLNLNPVYADPGQIQQVLMNLAINARDAMPEGGRLLIFTENLSLDEVSMGPSARWAVDLKPGSYVKLTLSDTGCGMDEATQKRAFEPFFTTKEVGKGTGLGLATVYGIVRNHGGSISVSSKPGIGTAFEILLPRAGKKKGLTTEHTFSGPPAVNGGKETILVVEDESQVRDVVCRVLDSLGYTVLQADHSDRAEEIVLKEKLAVDLLVTDVVLPGRSGPDLFQKLSRHRPALRVLYMSGYPEKHEAAGITVPDGLRPMLQKPFPSEDLAREVRQALSTSNSARQTGDYPMTRPEA